MSDEGCGRNCYGSSFNRSLYGDTEAGVRNGSTEVRVGGAAEVERTGSKTIEEGGLRDRYQGDVVAESRTR